MCRLKFKLATVVDLEKQMRISIESGVKARVVRYMANAKVVCILKFVRLAEFSLWIQTDG